MPTGTSQRCWKCEYVGINPLNAELNAICHLLALVGAHYILHVSRLRVETVVTFY